VQNYFEVKEQIDQFSQEVALICFNSKFIDRKIQGLKALTELLRSTKQKQLISGQKPGSASKLSVMVSPPFPAQ